MKKILLLIAVVLFGACSPNDPLTEDEKKVNEALEVLNGTFECAELIEVLIFTPNQRTLDGVLMHGDLSDGFYNLKGEYKSVKEYWYRVICENGQLSLIKYSKKDKSIFTNKLRILDKNTFELEFIDWADELNIRIYSK